MYVHYVHTYTVAKILGQSKGEKGVQQDCCDKSDGEPPSYSPWATRTKRLRVSIKLGGLSSVKRGSLELVNHSNSAV